MDTLVLANESQVEYVQDLLNERVVPDEVASPLRLILDRGTLEKTAASAAIRFLLAQPSRRPRRSYAPKPRVWDNIPACETVQ
jgi:hypothetical protein